MRQSLLKLAISDGWDAFYDDASEDLPKGSEYRYVDQLQRFPDLRGEANDRSRTQPMGQVTGVRLGSSGLIAHFPDSQLAAQPLFFATIVAPQFDVAEEQQYLFDGIVGNHRLAVLLETNTRHLVLFAGHEKRARVPLETNAPIVIGAHFNGNEHSRLFVNGAEVGLRDARAQSKFTATLSGLTLGNRFTRASHTRWQGLLGPVVIFRGVPTKYVRDRMMHTMLRAVSVSTDVSDLLSASSAIAFGPDGHSFSKHPDKLEVPASTIKLMTAYTARTFLADADLDRMFTADEADGLTGSGTDPRLLSGDLVSARDLLAMVLLPSHNAAARMVARVIGEMIPGSGNATQKFLNAMRDLTRVWGWEGAQIHSVTGLERLSRLSPRMLAELLVTVEREDSFLLHTMGLIEYTANVEGPNARELLLEHTIRAQGGASIPGVIGGKTGMLNNVGGNLAVLVKSKGGQTFPVVAMKSYPPNERFSDVRALIELREQRSRSWAETDRIDTELILADVLRAESSLPVLALKNRFAALQAEDIERDLTPAFERAGIADKRTQIRVFRSGNVVELSISGAKTSNEIVTIPVLTQGFRPQRVNATMWEQKTGQPTPLRIVGRTITWPKGTPGDRVDATITWITKERYPQV